MKRYSFNQFVRIQPASDGGVAAFGVAAQDCGAGVSDFA